MSVKTVDIKEAIAKSPQFRECVEYSHRNLPGTRLKSLLQDRWTQEEFQELLSNVSNNRRSDKMEKYLPIHYQRPSRRCSLILRNEFVRVKYLAREFEQPDSIRYLTQNSVSLPRVLPNARNSLIDCEVTIADRGHFLTISDKGSEAKLNAACRLDRIHLCFVGASVGADPHNWGTSLYYNAEHLMICYHHKNTYRFVYFNGRADVQYDLLQTVRRIQFHLIKLNQSGMASLLTEAEMAQQLTPSDILVGWLNKTGPRLKEQWRKRWCVLLHKHLYYFTAPFDWKVKGFIEFGDEGDIDADLNSLLVTSVTLDLPDSCRTPEGFPLVLKSKKRDFVFAADDLAQQKAWYDAFCGTLHSS